MPQWAVIGCPGPDRTDFARCVVANGEYEIHDRGVRLGKGFPAFGVQPLGRIANPLQQRDGVGIDRPLGVAPS